MPAHVPADRPKVKPAESPALFNFGEMDSAAQRRPQNIAQNPEEMFAVADTKEAGERWAGMLKTRHSFRSVSKKVAREFEQAGCPVDQRTVDGWLAGNLPSTNRHLLAALSVYGPIRMIGVYMPQHELAVAQEAEKAAALLRDLAGRLSEGGR